MSTINNIAFDSFVSQFMDFVKSENFELIGCPKSHEQIKDINRDNNIYKHANKHIYYIKCITSSQECNLTRHILLHKKKGGVSLLFDEEGYTFSSIEKDLALDGYAESTTSDFDSCLTLLHKIIEA